MKNVLRLFFAIIAVMYFAPLGYGQGSTTAALSGTIKDTNGEAIPGATVLVVHEPTGTQYGVAANAEGIFQIRNMNVGGPYKVTISAVGYETKAQSNIYLSLGQTMKMNFAIAESTQQMGEIVIEGKKDALIDGEKTGAATAISLQQIAALPTVNRSISDFTRLTPQATVTANGGISIAGTNNKFNSIFIDGAVNNDMYGLAETGTNGGQTGVSPISIDAIEAFEVVLAPYDVRQGGFSGGGINAVTRSGKNKFEGSAYYLFRNEGLAGKTPTDIEGVERKKLADFSSQTYGFRLGGPIIKDKLFFFTNVELQDDQTPLPFTLEEYTQTTGRASKEKLDELYNKLKNDYGYDAGDYGSKTDALKGSKFILRLDWNINKSHKLTFRHSYTKGDRTSPSRSSANTINFGNNGLSFQSTTNSSALELKSSFGSDKANNLIVGFTNVLDDRDPMGGDFPWVRINEPNGGAILFGSEEFSTSNDLKQSILTITDNFTLFKGKHAITIGTHNEFYKAYNLFIRQNYGSYVYDSLGAFMRNMPSRQFDRSFSLVDNVVGDDTDAAAEFSGMQFGFYVQDEYEVNEKIKVTAGLRLDIPIFNDKPMVDKYFNDSTIAKVEKFGYDMSKYRAGQMPNAQLMFAPRIGFNYDVNGDQTTQVRGGIGIFTSRIPLAWPGAVYTNSGVLIGGVRKFGKVFDPNINADAPTLPVTKSSGQIDLYSSDFKFPQVLRSSLAIDQKLPWGIVGTVELMVTKTLNNVFFQNVNIKPSTSNLSGTPDKRPIFSRSNLIDPTYTGIYTASNTSKGYTYNFTFQLQKAMDNGFSASLAYTYGSAYSVFDGTSTQNSSQWRTMNSVFGRNYAPLQISDFDMKHRIVGSLSYTKEYLGFASTTVSLFYNGQTGSPFSYIYNDVVTGGVNNEDSQERNLIYVPNGASEIVFGERVGSAIVPLSSEKSAAMWNELNEYISNDDYLKTRRGMYAERNAARLPFTNILDFRLLQDFKLKKGDVVKHNLQISLDIFNFTNLLNKEWGRMYFASVGQVELLDFVGYVTGGDGKPTTVPAFSYKKSATARWNIDDSGTTSSRWQAQLGIRYSF